MKILKKILFSPGLALFMFFCCYPDASLGAEEHKAGRISAMEQIKSDASYILEAPKRMSGKDYLILGSALAVSEIMYLDKDDINKKFQENRTNTSDDISKIIKSFGDKWMAMGLVSAFYSYGAFCGKEDPKETALMLGESLFYTAILAGAGQFVFAEDRPYEGGRMHYFRAFGHGVSGHAAISSAMAGPLNRQYLQIGPDDTGFEKFTKYTGKAAVYGIPLLVSLSRMNDNEHYAWNVILGSAIGYTMGELVANAHGKSKEKDMSVGPFIEGEAKGLVLNFRF